MSSLLQCVQNSMGKSPFGKTPLQQKPKCKNCLKEGGKACKGMHITELMKGGGERIGGGGIGSEWA